MGERHAVLILAGAAGGLLVHWVHNVAAYFTAPTSDHCTGENGRLAKNYLAAIGRLVTPGFTKFDTDNLLGLLATLVALLHWAQGLTVNKHIVGAQVTDRQPQLTDQQPALETDLDELGLTNYVPRCA